MENSKSWKINFRQSLLKERESLAKLDVETLYEEYKLTLEMLREIHDYQNMILDVYIEVEKKASP